MADKLSWLAWRKRVCEIIEVGRDQDWASRLYDLVNALVIFVNLAAQLIEGIHDAGGQIDKNNQSVDEIV